MRHLIGLVCCCAIVFSSSRPSCGQTEFKKALQQKYNFKSVNCFTCHARKSEIDEAELSAYKKKPKSFRNAFGKQFDEHFKDKDISKRLAGVKKLKRTDPKRAEVVDAVVAEFLAALQEVENVESPDGPTYGDLLKEAKLSGVKPK